MVVTVKKIGGSVGVLIPKAIATELGLIDGTPLDVRAGRDEIVMRKSERRTRRGLSEIIGKINPSAYRKRNRDLHDSGQAGKEIW
jgi:antitoxin component of MazEF toxin-antitoxin module